MSQLDLDPRMRRLSVTRTLPVQNPYTRALLMDDADWAFSEERAPKLQGKWRSEAFGCVSNLPLDLEIGTGNGAHFLHRCQQHSERLLVGIEVKYKPLIQTIRGARRANVINGRMARYHAFDVADLFAEGELNDVFVHFPDPWTSPRKPKNRLFQPAVLAALWRLQQPGSCIEFKTDSEEAFSWTLDQVKDSPYLAEAITRDLHKSNLAEGNFVTQFESIFLRQNKPIHFMRLRRGG